jgi:hypothetical protein
MVLLDDEAQAEARFCPFGESANLDTRWMHGLGRTLIHPAQVGLAEAQ